MQRLLAPVGSVMASVAFQFSVALYPDQLHHYAFLVPWIWVASGLCWAGWFFTHPWVKSHLSRPHQGSASTVSIPASSVPIAPEGPRDIVRFVGFETQGEEPTGALLSFQLDPITGEPVKNLSGARLRVTYLRKSDGKIIAEVFPAVWWDSGKGAANIGFTAQRAMIASYFQGKWTANEVVEIPMYLDSEIEEADSLSRTEYKPTELPIGEIKIIATIIGRRNIPYPMVKGILTLGEDGSASFVQDFL